MCSLASAQHDQRPDQLISFYKELYARTDHAPTPPQSDSVLTFLGRWSRGPCVAVAAKGNYAYISNGPMFQVLDVSNPAEPRIVGEYETWVSDIFIRDTVAFIAGNSFVILNVSDPTNPRLISELEYNAGVRRVMVEGDFAYLLTGNGSLRVVDINNLHAPYWRGFIGGVGGDVPRSLAVRNGYAYIGDLEFPRISVVNATNPDSLWGRNILFVGIVVSLHASDTLLYVGRSTRLQPYSIVDPMNPVPLGSVNVTGILSAITVSGSTAYVTTDGSGIYAVDVSNPMQPVVVDSLKPTSPAIRTGVAIAADGENVYSAQSVGLWIAGKDSLPERTYFRTGDRATRVFVKGNLAYVASGEAGLWILDISDPGKPRGIANVNTGSFTCDVAATDTIAYFVNYPQSTDDSARGVWAVNISDPHSPRILSRYIGIVRRASFRHFNSVSLVGSLLFLSQMGSSTQDSTLEIIDVSDPGHLTRVSVFRNPYGPYHVAARESIACLANPIGGLIVVDWSNPYNPTQLSGLGTSMIGVAVKDTLTFADQADSIFILSVANPIVPRIIGRYGRTLPQGFTSTDLFAQNKFLYWAGGDGLGVLDFSYPANPKSIGYLAGPVGVAASGNTVVAAVSAAGVWIYRNDYVVGVKEHEATVIPKEVSLFQNFPNPFNPSTTIRFSLPKRSTVMLEVFDLLGRRVETLLTNVAEPGTHNITWDASSLTSGVYLYRLTTETTSTTKPMVLIK